jgi:biotin synthase
MGRWGLEGMSSFEQHNVARKEGERLASTTSSSQTADA